MSEINWDVNGYEKQSGGFDPVPAGDYVVKITKHEWKLIGNDKAKGERLNLTLDIIEGDLKGRKLFEGLNVKATAPRAEGKKMSSAEFARGQFRSIVDCCGLVSCKNVAELYNIPFVVSVSLKAKTDKPNEMQNEIRGYKKRERRGDALPTGNGGSVTPASNAAPWGVAPTPTPVVAPTQAA